MSKYKNIAKINLMVSIKGKLTLLAPGEVIELGAIPFGYENYLTEQIEEKKEVDIADIIEHQSGDLPEDFVVVIDDEVVDSLRKEQSTQPQKKTRRRRSKG